MQATQDEFKKRLRDDALWGQNLRAKDAKVTLVVNETIERFQLPDLAPPTAPAFKTALRRILGLVNETAVKAHSRQVKRESTVSQDSGPAKTHNISVSERVNPASFLPQPVKTPANAESIQFYISDNTKQCRLVSTLRNTIGSWEMEINVNILALVESLIYILELTASPALHSRYLREKGLNI